MLFETVLIIILLVIFISLLIFFLKKISSLKNSSADSTLISWLQSMNQTMQKTNTLVVNSLNTSNKNIADTLQRNTANINKRLDSAINVISDSTEQLTKMTELGNTIKDLQLLLKAPKLRGNLGEEILADMLGQVFPKDAFKLQYSFKSGVKVDAAIQTTAGILPIDAKFPLENYQKQFKAETSKERKLFKTQFVKDVKKHIKDISSKYILVDEDTVDFAFMYVPSEAVFLEIANLPELMQFSRSLRVYPVSPNTLYAHLQTVLLAFESQEIEKKARKILAVLKTLQKQYFKFEENYELLGKHLNNAKNQYDKSSHQFTLLGQKINQQEILESGE
jgi:DNA recombination protein RmuC